MIEVMVESIRVSLVTQQRLVVLRENDSPRFLPIWIGPFEADAINMGLQRPDVPRPMTHDLLGMVIHDLGAQVRHVCINDMRDETFYAQLVVDADGRDVSIDARPSDAIALAVRLGVSIFVAESVMDAAGQLPAADVRGEGDAQAGVAEGGDDSLEVFRDFIESLDLGDLEDD